MFTMSQRFTRAALLLLPTTFCVPACSAENEELQIDQRDLNGDALEFDECCLVWSEYHEQRWETASWRITQWLKDGTTDFSTFANTNATSGAVQFSRGEVSGQNTVELLLGSFPLNESNAHTDLLWLATEHTCDGDLPFLVGVYLRPGETYPNNVQEAHEVHASAADFVTLADDCFTTRIVGAKEIPNTEFTYPVIENASGGWTQARATYSYLDRDPSQSYVLAAATDPESVSWKQVYTDVDYFPRSGVSYHRTNLRFGGANLNEGLHYVQADCGEGWTSVRPLDYFGRFNSGFVPFPEALDSFIEDKAQLRDCDVRVGFDSELEQLGGLDDG